MDKSNHKGGAVGERRLRQIDQLIGEIRGPVTRRYDRAVAVEWSAGGEMRAATAEMAAKGKELLRRAHELMRQALAHEAGTAQGASIDFEYGDGYVVDHSRRPRVKNPYVAFSVRRNGLNLRTTAMPDDASSLERTTRRLARALAAWEAET